MEGKNVAPLVGAWIEILDPKGKGNGSTVAPLVGAWIEIGDDTFTGLTLERRSPCGSVD